MNLSNPLNNFTSALFLLLLLLSASSTTATLNLFELQPISNFPTSCTSAYNVEIRSCTTDEITTTGRITSSGQGVCSSECIAALTIVNRNINSACQGVLASPNTLIGLFFSGKGVSYLCPNSVEGSEPVPTSTAEDDNSTSSAEATSTSSSSSAASETSTSESATTTTTTTESSSSSTQIPETTPSFQPTTAVNNGIPTIITSEAQRTEAAKSNPDAFGGGGSPFEVAENSATAFSSRNAVPALMAIAVSLGWGVMIC